jgi:type II secretory pathway component PulF
MPTFSYTAVDARGKQANGKVDAADQNDAIAQIRQQGLYPQRLDEAREDTKVVAEDKPKVKKGGAARSSPRC